MIAFFIIRQWNFKLVIYLFSSLINESIFLSYDLNYLFSLGSYSKQLNPEYFFTSKEGKRFALNFSALHPYG